MSKADGNQGLIQKEVPTEVLRFLRDALLNGTLNFESNTAVIVNQLGIAEPDAYYLASELLPAFRASAMSSSNTAAYLRGYLEATARSPQAPELVFTGPQNIPGWLNAVETRLALSEMIRDAKSRILLVGYSLTRGGFPVLQELAGAVGRGVRTTLILDEQIDAELVFRDAWPRGIATPHVLQFVSSQKTEASSMHAKTMACDGKDLLVTSANLSFRGLHRNIEAGVRMKGSIALRFEEFFTFLGSQGLVVECSGVAGG